MSETPYVAYYEVPNVWTGDDGGWVQTSQAVVQGRGVHRICETSTNGQTTSRSVVKIYATEDVHNDLAAIVASPTFLGNEFDQAKQALRDLFIDGSIRAASMEDQVI